MGGPHHQQLYVDSSSRIHLADPTLKLVALVSFVTSIATLPTESRIAVAVGLALVIVAIWQSKLSLSQVVRRMLPALPLIIAACLIPLISSDPDAGAAARTLVAKIIIGAGASVVFASTTRPTELVVALQRLGVPAVVVGIVSFMFRYLDMMVGELARIRVALTSRGYQPSWLGQAKPIASAGGVMLARSFERGERVHSAMTARGFNGTLLATTQQRPRPKMWIVALVPAVIIVLTRLTA